MPEPRSAAGALLFAVLSAGFFWAGWSLGTLPRATPFAAIGGLAVAAPVLLLLGRSAPPLRGIAGALIAIVPVVTVVSLFVMAERASGLAGGLRLWPAMLGALAGLFALGLLRQSRLRQAFVAGALLLALAVTLAVTAGQGALVDRWIIRTPVHLAIALIALVLIAALLARVTAPDADAAEGGFVGRLVPLLPLLGFLGTIWGITLALSSLPAVFNAPAGGPGGTGDPEALNDMLAGLATAFETTLIGVGAAIAITFLDAITTE